MEETVNIPLLRKAVEWVETQAKLPTIDREWEQSTYISSPSKTALSLIWDKLEYPFDNPFEQWSYVDILEPHCGTTYCVAGYISQLCDSRYKDRFCVDEVSMPDFAAEQLGLTPLEASRLFHATNTASDVRTIAEEITGEPL